MLSVKDRKKPKRSRKPTAENPWPDRLRAVRERLGITQEQAAERIDAPVSTWRNWEQGRRIPNPMIAKLIDLAFPE